MRLPKLVAVTPEGRRVYPFQSMVNGRELNRLIIDPHFEEKHGSYMSDEKIWEIVKFLNGKRFIPVKYKGKYEVFETNILYQPENYKNYLLIWCLENEKNYLGIIHCYRKSKYDQKK